MSHTIEVARCCGKVFTRWKGHGLGHTICYHCNRRLRYQVKPKPAPAPARPAPVQARQPKPPVISPQEAAWRELRATMTVNVPSPMFEYGRREL